MGEIPSGLTISSTSSDSSDEKWSSRRVKVGGFVIDFNQKVAIAPDDEEKNLTANTIKLLFLLLDNQDTFVSADDIHDYIYGNQYKDDSSVRKQVTFLRKVFNDTAKDKKYIENKLGHGYRLVVPVEVLDTATTDSDRKWYQKAKFWVSITSTVLLIVASVFFYFQQLGSAPIRISYTTPKPLTHLKGQELYPEISSDNNWLLLNYNPQDKENWQIYIKDLIKGDLIALFSDDYDYRLPKWGNDDNSILYTRIKGDSCEFMLADFDVVEKTIKNQRVLTTCVASARNSQVELWPDGQGFYYNTAESFNLPFKIYSYSFSQSEGWAVASPPPSGKGDYDFSLSKDGLWLAVVRNKNWLHSEIWVYNTETWETKLIDTVGLTIFSVNWGSDSNSLIYRNESNQVVKYDLLESEKSILSQPSTPFIMPLLVGADSQKVIAVGGTLFNNDIQKYYLSDGRQELLVESSFRDFIPAVSQDGTQLAWISNRTGIYQIWYQFEDSLPESLTNIGNNITFSSLEFSPDGSMLGGTAGGRWFIYKIDEREVEWSSDNEYFSHFQWRREGKSAFLSKREGDGWRHMSLEISSGQVSPVPASPKGTLIALESKTHYVDYYTTLNETGFWRVKDGIRQFFPTETSIYAAYNWASTEKGLYFISAKKLMFLSIDKENTEVVVNNFKGETLAMPNNTDWFISETLSSGDTSIIEFQ